MACLYLYRHHDVHALCCLQCHQAVGALALKQLLPALLAWLPDGSDKATSSLLPKVRQARSRARISLRGPHTAAPVGPYACMHARAHAFDGSAATSVQQPGEAPCSWMEACKRGRAAMRHAQFMLASKLAVWGTNE